MKPGRPAGGPAAARRRGSLLRRLLASCDWLALTAALVIVNRLDHEFDSATLFWAVLFSPTWILVFKLHGLYDHDHRRIRHSTIDELSPALAASAFGTLAIVGLLSLSPAEGFSPRVAVGVAAIALVATMVLRALVRAAWRATTSEAMGVVVGSGDLAATLARRLATHPETRLRLVGYLGEPSRGSTSLPTGAHGLPWLGRIGDLAELSHTQGIERVVVADAEMTTTHLARVIQECKDAGLGLTLLPQHSALLGPGVELNRLAELPLLDFGLSDPPRSTMLLKRAVDIAISALLLAVLTPIFLLIAALIKLDSRGPVFFRQARAGQNGEPFTMLKFRTMVSDAEERLRDLVDISALPEPAFKIPDDPRITRVGRFLRRTSLDELPQLINVLRGDMSLVGPRPEEEAVVALYSERQRARLVVKPGMTGPMQVYGRGDLSFEERLALERDYLDNISIAGDLAILLRTPRAMLRGDGAY